jgi:hypothetical protein
MRELRFLNTSPLLHVASDLHFNINRANRSAEIKIQGDCQAKLREVASAKWLRAGESSAVLLKSAMAACVK